jgi:cation diffusion facilitator CzcD-associated flavoprotein CzcO
MPGSNHVVIVGTGFSGLGLAIRLKQSGFDDFTVLERAGRVGGTWRDNDYPGAACDVESHLYSFSFEPNPAWTRTYAPQPEILGYLEHCARKYGVLSHIRFSTAATGARFDDASGLWSVSTSRGDTLTARALVMASGGLSRPAYPDIPGLRSFAGEVFHSARWNHDVSLNNKDIAVIGTGASAIQIVPALAPIARRLEVFQRTPPWIIPRRDRGVSDRARGLFRRVPTMQRLVRFGQFARHEAMGLGFVWKPAILKFAQRLAVRHLHAQVADPALRARLLPDYVMGCKRVLLSDDYYPALVRENVALVTEPIREITPRGIVTADGREHAQDALVLATGFEAAEAVAPFEVRGRDGLDLNDAWRSGAEAYLGTTIAGFPNLFLMTGPNTGLGHSSMVLMIESQIAYILAALRTMRERGLSSVEVRADVQAGFNATLRERLTRTVWNTGCTAWYTTRAGKNTTLWPGLTVEFRWRTRRFEAGDYRLASLPDR